MPDARPPASRRISGCVHTLSPGSRPADIHFRIEGCPDRKPAPLRASADRASRPPRLIQKALLQVESVSSLGDQYLGLCFPFLNFINAIRTELFQNLLQTRRPADLQPVDCVRRSHAEVNSRCALRAESVPAIHKA